jgi:hypothetical protein
VVSVREARINEQLTELDGRVQRWSRVPRICASISTSAGFLFASIALLRALALPAGEENADAVHSTLSSALGAAAVGIAGMSFCVAVHVRARRALSQWQGALDTLVKQLSSSFERSPRGSA